MSPRVHQFQISGFDAQTISQRAISKTADGKVSVEGTDYNNGMFKNKKSNVNQK